jgi:hypothetical protein
VKKQKKKKMTKKFNEENLDDEKEILRINPFVHKLDWDDPVDKVRVRFQVLIHKKPNINKIIVIKKK